MSIFVQAIDGKFYKQPIIWDACNSSWWICFPEGDNGPEVIVCASARSTPNSAKVRASRMMREAGIKFKDLKYYQQCNRIYPPTWDSFKESYNYSFQLLAPIPIPLKFDAVVNYPIADCCMYGFFSDVSSEDCAKAVLGMDMDLLIARALLAKPYYVKSSGVKAEIAKKLYKQVPWLRELTKENWQEILKNKPLTVRLKWRLPLRGEDA